MARTLDRGTARRIILSLGESGQPPKLGASVLNVGTDDLIEKIRSRYLLDELQPIDGDGFGGCRWVVADYGNGKTQFLRCLQESAWELNYVTAFVELSQGECPLHQPEKVYAAVARSIQAKPANATDLDQGQGLDAALIQLLELKFPGVRSASPDDDARGQAMDWVRSKLQQTPIENKTYRDVVVQYLLAELGGRHDQADLARKYLLGEQLLPSQLSALGVKEKLDKSNGFRFLRSMTQLLQRAGLAAGTLLLFDEARRVLSLMTVREQKQACENLLSIIGHCNDFKFPGTLFVYAVMPEFFATFAPLYPALQQRITIDSQINLNTLANIHELELLVQIGDRITQVFKTAHPDVDFDARILKHNLGVVAKRALKQTMGTGTRRLLVKTWVMVLREARESGLKELTDAGIDKVLKGVAEGLSSREMEEVESEGE